MASCKKDGNPNVTVSSLNVIDASQVAPLMTINFTFSPVAFSLNGWVSHNQQLPYGYVTEYANPSGNLPLELISSQDTLHPFYKNTVNFPAGSIHSLYVIGNSTTPETLLLEDHIPALPKIAYRVSSSSIFALTASRLPLICREIHQVRQNFPIWPISKSPTLKPIRLRVHLVQMATRLKSGMLLRAISLTTFTWYFKIFFCNTLVIEGLENDNTGNFPVSVAQVNHYVYNY